MNIDTDINKENMNTNTDINTDINKENINTDINTSKEENVTAVIPIRSILHNKKIRTLPTFVQMCKRLDVNTSKKGDCMVVTGLEADVIRDYVMGKVSL